MAKGGQNSSSPWRNTTKAAASRGRRSARVGHNSPTTVSPVVLPCGTPTFPEVIQFHDAAQVEGASCDRRRRGVRDGRRPRPRRRWVPRDAERADDEYEPRPPRVRSGRAACTRRTTWRTCAADGSPMGSRRPDPPLTKSHTLTDVPKGRREGISRGSPRAASAAAR